MTIDEIEKAMADPTIRIDLLTIQALIQIGRLLEEIAINTRA